MDWKYWFWCFVKNLKLLCCNKEHHLHLISQVKINWLIWLKSKTLFRWGFFLSLHKIIQLVFMMFWPFCMGTMMTASVKAQVSYVSWPRTCYISFVAPNKHLMCSFILVNGIWLTLVSVLWNLLRNLFQETILSLHASYFPFIMRTINLVASNSSRKIRRLSSLLFLELFLSSRNWLSLHNYWGSFCYDNCKYFNKLLGTS